jgi:SAM-dependent methyltransferase/uncharacterized protein YbaR (Trm112 family)
LALSVWREEREIEEGLLACHGCQRTYPIINGIPRMLPDALAHVVLRHHQDFFTRYAAATSSFCARASHQERTTWWKTEARTVETYSYQWRKFKQMFAEWEQVFLDSIAPVRPEFFEGRVGLDGGCGFGRSMFYAARYGAEIIGLDLSEAIEAARENTGHLSKVHLVQGDLYHPPIRPKSLDFVYSIGVVMLLPDPKAGFLSLSRLLKPGAPIFIWVYPRGRGRQIAVFTALRALTTRLPLQVLNAVTLAFAAAQWVTFIAPFKLLQKSPATARVADAIPFTLYARYPFRVMHTDWFDGLSVPVQNYHRPEEIAGWYEQAGCEKVQIDEHWNGRAIGFAPSETRTTTI